MDSSLAKLGRAQTHLEALKALIDGHDKSIEVWPELETDPAGETVSFAVKVTRAEPVPVDEWGPVLGDAIQNLRASLDHLAYALVAKCQGSPWEESQFPLADDPAYYSSRDKGTLKRLETTERAVVERHQPYAGKHGLALLRDISVEDKHRQLILVFVEADLTLKAKIVRDCTDPEWSDLLIDKPLETGAILGRVTVRRTGTEPEMQVGYTHSPFVRLEKWGRIEDVLNLIQAEVAELFAEAQPLF
jgi:hypothetical protein